jgi:hypothetical protein
MSPFRIGRLLLDILMDQYEKFYDLMDLQNDLESRNILWNESLNESR